jgi:hypothetical protein
VEAEALPLRRVAGAGRRRVWGGGVSLAALPAVCAGWWEVSSTRLAQIARLKVPSASNEDPYQGLHLVRELGQSCGVICSAATPRRRAASSSTKPTSGL